MDDPYQKLDAFPFLTDVGYHFLHKPTHEEQMEMYDRDREIRPALQCLKYSHSLTQGLHKLQSNASLCDLTLLVEGKVFHAHRCVLAAVSPYFEAMFTSGFQEKDKQEIEIKDVECRIFEKLLNCAYSGKIEDLSLDNAMDVFDAAVYLQFTHAQKMVVDYLSNTIQEKNAMLEDVFRVMVIAEEHGLDNLTEECCKCLVTSDNDFVQIIATEEFTKKGPAWLIYRFLGRGYESAEETNEEKLMFAINRWLRYDWDTRKHHAAKLMKGLRLGLVPFDKVKEVIDVSMLQEVPECQEILDNLVKNLCLFADTKKDSTHATYLPESFLPRNMIRTLISVGGEEYSDIDYYDEGTATWTGLSKPSVLPYNEEGLSNAAATVVNGELYVGGGAVSKSGDEDTENFKCFNRFFKLDKTSYEWEELPNMEDARSFFTLAYFENCIYAVGGKGDDDYVDTVERFNISTQRWDRTYTLPEPMMDTRAVVLDGQLLVYGVTSFDEGVGFTYALVAFDHDQWIKILEEKFDEKLVTENITILAQDKKCYRVCYSDNEAVHTVHINQIQVKRQVDGALTASLGTSIPNTMVRNEVHAFIIGESMYINLSGVVYKVAPYRICNDLAVYLNKMELFTRDYTVVPFTLDLSKAK